MNKQRVSLICVATSVALLAGGSAVAQEGFYFGLSGGLATLDLPSKRVFDFAMGPELVSDLASDGFNVTSLDGSSLDDSDMAWGLHVGYRWNSYVALEIGYVNLGDALYELFATADDGVEAFPVEKSVQFSSAGPSASVLGMFPLGERFDIHARAGIYFGDTEIRNRALDVEFSENLTHERFDGGDEDLFFGVGGAWSINESYSLRVEYQRFANVGDDNDTGEFDIDFLSLSVLFR